MPHCAATAASATRLPGRCAPAGIPVNDRGILLTGGLNTRHWLVGFAPYVVSGQVLAVPTWDSFHQAAGWQHTGPVLHLAQRLPPLHWDALSQLLPPALTPPRRAGA